MNRELILEPHLQITLSPDVEGVKNETSPHVLGPASIRFEDPTQWLSLTEYSVKHRLSLSTLRRYIKSGKVTYRVVSGKYFIFSDEPVSLSSLDSGTSAAGDLDQDKIDKQLIRLRNENLKLKVELSAAREEISELKTLVSFYEEN